MTRTVAHRGFRALAPENTVRAAREAVGHDPWAVEVDVRPTADGDPVCFHDPRLDDLTDRRGAVHETPTSEVTAARVAGTDATVPLLTEVLAAVPPDVTVVVEAKTDGPTGTWPSAFLDRTLDAAAAAPVVHQSFDDDWTRAVRDRTTAPVAVLSASDPDATLALASALGARAVHLAWPLYAGAGLDGSVAPAEPDVECWAWTVPDRETARALAGAGVDAQTVDDPAVVGSSGVAFGADTER